jgi:hypothetical protein
MQIIRLVFAPFGYMDDAHKGPVTDSAPRRSGYCGEESATWFFMPPRAEAESSALALLSTGGLDLLLDLPCVH